MTFSIPELIERADLLAQQPTPIPSRPAVAADRLGSFIDHTLLKPEATGGQVDTLCREALEYSFASVCINGVYVPRAVKLLSGSVVKVCTVAGFPLGAVPTLVKADEAHMYVEMGAAEVDMVIPIGRLKGGEVQAVFDDIQAVAEATHAGGAILKVILEMAMLNRREKILGCLLSKAAGAEFVKTSTGFGPGGATVEDVRLMRWVVGEDTLVKAAGGVRSLTDARAMIAAGADRLGSSAGVKIMKEALA